MDATATDLDLTDAQRSSIAWNVARLNVQKNQAAEAARQAALQASSALPNAENKSGWVNRALSGFGLAQPKETAEAGIRAAQAAAMLASQTFLEKTQNGNKNHSSQVLGHS